MKQTVATLAAAVLCLTVAAARAESVRVGVIAELTGDMPAVGASCRNAANGGEGGQRRRRHRRRRRKNSRWS